MTLLKSGAIFSSTSDRISHYNHSGPSYYYFANLAWFNEKIDKWDERDGGIIVRDDEDYFSCYSHYMSNLKKLTDEQFIPLLNESEHAFLPTKNNPDETATSLVEKFKNNANYDVFGYITGNRAISYVIALSGRNDNEIAIGPMYVAKDSRGNGFGKRQIADFIQLFTERGYASIFTKTWQGNAASRHSFESLGFIEISRGDGDRVDGDSTISYELRITK